MQITFNPSLTSSRMSNTNCCGGGRKVAFGRDYSVESLMTVPGARELNVAVIGGLKANETLFNAALTAFRSKISLTTRRELDGALTRWGYDTEKLA